MSDVEMSGIKKGADPMERGADLWFSLMPNVVPGVDLHTPEQRLLFYAGFVAGLAGSMAGDIGRGGVQAVLDSALEVLNEALPVVNDMADLDPCGGIHEPTAEISSEPAPRPTDFFNPLTLQQARSQRVCRICRVDDKSYPGNPFNYYGAEYAHQKCLDAFDPCRSVKGGE